MPHLVGWATGHVTHRSRLSKACVRSAIASATTGIATDGTPANGWVRLTRQDPAATGTAGSDGRRLTFMIVVGNVPISTPAEFDTITDEQARMVAAIQEHL